MIQHNHICSDCWKNIRSTFGCMVFPNPGDKFQILVESMGQICPVVLHLFWTLSPGFENNHIFKCWSGIFPTILTYMIMLENCKKIISVYGCSPIQGTTFYSRWNLMKPGSRSGTEGRADQTSPEERCDLKESPAQCSDCCHTCSTDRQQSTWAKHGCWN